MDVLEFLREQSNILIRGCTKNTNSGITIFTPDGIASYDALWIRDFSYMVEYAGELITNEEIEECIHFTLSGMREDGWMPDRIYADGSAVYAAGEVGKPIGKANLDNTPFLVNIISDFLPRIAPSKASILFSEWYDKLSRGLLAIPRDDLGLVWSDPNCPHSPYGFTDTVAKTGSLTMESLLLWRACQKMSSMCSSYGYDSTTWRNISSAIECNLGTLYDTTSGMFFAASLDCKQIDIWASAYMLYIGFPSSKYRSGILEYLALHKSDYVFEGQIRHLPKSTYWERLLIDVPHETYQNGAYWATATGWIGWCLYQTNKQLGLQVFQEAICYLRDKGSYECVNDNYQKLGSFVVSTTNIWGGLKRLISEDNSVSSKINAAF